MCKILLFLDTFVCYEKNTCPAFHNFYTDHSTGKQYMPGSDV